MFPPAFRYWYSALKVLLSTGGLGCRARRDGMVFRGGWADLRSISASGLAPAHCLWPSKTVGVMLLAMFTLFGRSALFAKEPPKPATTEAMVFFESKVRPLLVEHCYECHSARAEKLKAGLMLDSRARMLQGGESGAALVPSQADESPLIEAVRYTSTQMPPKGKLPQRDIEVLETWVNMGAPWPEEPEPTKNQDKQAFDLNARKDSHWMWQPIRNPQIPSVNQVDWVKQPLDRFILAKLEESGLRPAPAIDRRGLMRRLSFDLLGLPPNSEEVDRFVQDDSADAIDKLVDSMLRSPRFGERWGRHWLDLVRYAESRGHEFDADIPNAYHYRDYVIRALNADVPYDLFLQEHIAGDLLDNPRLHPESRSNESILGTGFWLLGEWVHSPVDIRKDESDRFDNMIDVMTKTFLGVTVSCARCHDHKFDAISTRDYYSLTGFLQGSQYRQVRFETMELERKVAEELESLDKEFGGLAKQTIVDLWPKHRSDAVHRWRTSNPSAEAKSEMPWATMPVPWIGEDQPNSKIVVDYTSKEPSRLLQDGWIFGRKVRQPNEMRLEDVAGTPTPQFAQWASVRSDPFWNGMVAKRERPTNRRSKIESLPRPGRTMLTPSFVVEHGTVSCLIRGNGHIVACVDSHRLVEGPLHGETIREVSTPSDGFAWVPLNLSRYIGHRIHLEFTPAEDQGLEVIGARDGKQAEKQVRFRNALALESDRPYSLEESVDAAIMAMKVTSDPIRREEAVPVAAWNWILRNSRLLFSPEPNVRNELDRVVEEWISKRKELRSSLASESRIAPAMIDGTGENDRVLIRGNSSVPGEITPRRFLEAIDGAAPLCSGNESGRLQLAERINDPSNPLTSRVLVNRVWHHLLGRGIVPTVDDFGFLGQRPSHPELLDHLSVQFNQKGKSIKDLIRMIVLSQTYQMSGAASAKSLESDPKNTLWQHLAPKRLTGEAIRDSLLSVSGELNLSMYGESVPIYLTTFMDGRGRPAASGPLDGDKRRSIYVAVRRNFLSPFMTTFDTPNPFSTMGKRNVSNVPSQALILMNDPFVVERAKIWAERTLQKSASTVGDAIDWMYQVALGRPATSIESAIAIRFIREQAQLRNTDERDVLVWTDLAHSIFNLKEFVFLR